MKALQNFVAQKNHWNSFFNGEQSLSPENLTCDGELPRAEVNRRYKELMTAAKQLKKLDPSVTFYEYESEVA